MWRYYAFKIIGSALSLLPWTLGYLIAHITAEIIYILSPPLRSTIAHNIYHVLGPQADNDRLKRTIQGVLRNASKNYFDFIKLPRLTLSEILNSITVRGQHHLDDAVKQGKGAILFTAHLGSFDIAAQVFTTYHTKVTIVVEPINPPILLDYVTALRKKAGLGILPAQSGALRQMLKILRRGEILIFALDRDTTGDGVQSSFFGKDTNMPTEAIKIAMRTGAAIVPVFNKRRDDVRHYDIYVEPAIDVVRSGTDALAKNMKQIITVMERYIRQGPDQWVVLSPIWTNE